MVEVAEPLTLFSRWVGLGLWNSLIHFTFKVKLSSPRVRVGFIDGADSMTAGGGTRGSLPLACTWDDGENESETTPHVVFVPSTAFVVRTRCVVFSFSGATMDPERNSELTSDRSESDLILVTENRPTVPNPE